MERVQVMQHRSDFISKLERGEKVFVVGLDAPFDAQMDKFSKGVYALKGKWSGYDNGIGFTIGKIQGRCSTLGCLCKASDRHFCDATCGNA